MSEGMQLRLMIVGCGIGLGLALRWVFPPQAEPRRQLKPPGAAAMDDERKPASDATNPGAIESAR